jgi:protein-disulfide isomerase
MNTHRIAILVFFAAVAIFGSVAVHAQNAGGLKPPKGSNLALVVFEDLQCPDCARADSLLQEAARTYSIPLVVYDFPLPKHSWAFEGSVLAKYFGTQSRKLEDEFRDYIFKNQAQVTPENLRGMAERFAEQRKVDLPFIVDPQGELAKAVKDDRNLGQKIGISHTPTIYVVSNKRTGAPFVEVVDRNQLFQLIDQMKREQ